MMTLINVTILFRIMIVLSSNVMFSLADYYPSKKTVLVTRSIDSSTIIANLDDAPDCNYAGDITFSHPQSIDKNDKYYGVGSLSYESVAMTVDYINTQRCGITMNGKNYSITLKTYGDNSNAEKHTAIANAIVNSTDFILSGYSSGLAAHLAPIAKEHGKLLVAGGSSRTSIYADNDYAFAIMPPSSTFLDGAFAGLSTVVNNTQNNNTNENEMATNLTRKVTTVAALYEDGASSCSSVEELSNKYGFELVANVEIVENPTDDMFDVVAEEMSVLKPDIMITCVYGVGCAKWIGAMRKVNWIPKAQVFTICPGSEDLESNVQTPTDLEYIMGASSWDPSLVIPQPDGATGWTPGEYANSFRQVTLNQPPLYQHVAAATAISVLVQAVEKANTIETQSVRKQLLRSKFSTFYGEVGFDGNGQNDVKSLLLQYTVNNTLQVVYPLVEELEAESTNITAGTSDSNTSGSKSTTPTIVYPMPTWDHRDCIHVSKCYETNGTCLSDGTCDCSNSATVANNNDNNNTKTEEKSIVSIGIGSAAFCKEIPYEDMTYISNELIIGGMILFVIQLILSSYAMYWTIKYRDYPVVRMSQPEFLLLINFGCITLISSIIPISIENGEYRYLQDSITRQLNYNIMNPKIFQLDVSCMAFPWLVTIGFSIIFSALFTKIWRVKKLLNSTSRLRRKTIQIKDVLHIMATILVVEVILLLCWQFISPLKWEREVLLVDNDSFPIKSLGGCISNQTFTFVSLLAIFNGLLLLYSLYLCYETKHVPSDFAEGKWVTITIISIFQILVLSVPVLIIANESRNASYFLRACIVFIITLTVTCVIFIPKMKRLNETLSGPSKSSDGNSVLSGISGMSFNENSGRFSGGDSKSRRNLLMAQSVRRLQSGSSHRPRNSRNGNAGKNGTRAGRKARNISGLDLDEDSYHVKTNNPNKVISTISQHVSDQEQDQEIGSVYEDDISFASGD